MAWFYKLQYTNKFEINSMLTRALLKSVMQVIALLPIYTTIHGVNNDGP